MTQVTEDLIAKKGKSSIKQDKKLLSQIIEHLPLDCLSIAEKQAFIDGRGGAAHWLAWHLRRYHDKVINPNVLLVDRSVKFDTSFVARGAFDKPGGKWKAFDLTPLSQLGNSEFLISKICLRHIGSRFEKNEYPLGVQVLQTLLLQKERIPKDWSLRGHNKEVCIVFAGTRLIDTYGKTCYLVLRFVADSWQWDCFASEKITENNNEFSFVAATYQED